MWSGIGKYVVLACDSMKRELRVSVWLRAVGCKVEACGRAANTHGDVLDQRTGESERRKCKNISTGSPGRVGATIAQHLVAQENRQRSNSPYTCCTKVADHM